MICIMLCRENRLSPITGLLDRTTIFVGLRNSRLQVYLYASMRQCSQAVKAYYSQLIGINTLLLSSERTQAIRKLRWNAPVALPALTAVYDVYSAVNVVNDSQRMNDKLGLLSCESGKTILLTFVYGALTYTRHPLCEILAMRICRPATPAAHWHRNLTV
ncbi:hypothetical protein BC629DRAFT_318808 [Irpex lacteus]|nr:hypothetical protein BC629DRAFT_318808 [Irpex lacteus]